MTTAEIAMAAHMAKLMDLSTERMVTCFFLPFPSDCYEPDVLALMLRAFDAACQEVVARRYEPDLRALHRIMELRIMVAVREGERDAGRLKELALQAIKGI